MHQRKHIYGFSKWGHKLYAGCLLGALCLALACMAGVASGAPSAYAAGVPGGNVADPVVRAVDIAKPAVVRILTEVAGQLTVKFSNGQSVTFPRTPQNGVNGYIVGGLGTGTFISAHGDILTADHVVNIVQDDKEGVDAELQQNAAQDIADYINQTLHPAQPATADLVAGELASGQLLSTSQYQTPQSIVYRSTDFSGALTATNINDVPSSQYAVVDQIKEHSSFNNLDIAIIHVTGMDDMPMVQLGDSSAVQEQDNLTIIGFPGNGDVSNNASDLLTSSINQVLVSSIKSTDNGAPLIQVGGNVEQGDSGGPALDNHGNVVGIVSFGVAATSGSTSFLRTGNSAKQLMQQANINTAPSALQKIWSQAFTDYASTSAGHWHKATQEFQQITTSYPQFKAVSQFAQYAATQAKTESTSQSGGAGTGSSLLTLSPLTIGIGAVVLFLILVVAGFAISHRRQPAVAAVSSQYPGQNYGATPYPGQNGQVGSPYPGQNGQVGSPYPGQNGQVGSPTSPSYQSPAFYQQPQGQQAYASQQPATLPQQGFPSGGSQPSYWPQAPQTPQQSFPSGAPQQVPGDMASFGAPPATPALGSATDPRMVARSVPTPQWRTWPCGHTNRDDARFCGVCGEVAPPIANRIEQ